VINLLVRALHPMRQPLDQVLGVIGIDSTDVFEPRSGFIRIAVLECWRSVKIGTGDAGTFNKATIGEEAAFDNHRLTWRPGHLLHWLVLVEPL
jgi:hypothetical protein